MHNQHARELISARKMSHKHNTTERETETETETQRDRDREKLLPTVALTWYACKYKELRQTDRQTDRESVAYGSSHKV